jgi:hypothetical protein
VIHDFAGCPAQFSGLIRDDRPFEGQEALLVELFDLGLGQHAAEWYNKSGL